MLSSGAQGLVQETGSYALPTYIHPKSEGGGYWNAELGPDSTKNTGTLGWNQDCFCVNNNHRTVPVPMSVSVVLGI